MDIRILGAHNCESQSSKLVSLLIDDVLVIDAGALTSSLSLAAQKRLKAVLLTHRHYDHIRDIPALAMNLFLNGGGIEIYSTLSVYDAITAHLLNGELYPRFLKRPEGNPTIKFNLIEPFKAERVDGYSVMAVPVIHHVPTVGYQVTSSDGKVIFYTGDAGPGLAECWEHISPQLLIIEATSSNRFEEFAARSGHLTPSLLERELVSFRDIKGYLPRITVIHMSPNLENEIETEIAALSGALNIPIAMASEGMLIQL